MKWYVRSDGKIGMRRECGSKRDWWMVKYDGSHAKHGCIYISRMKFPESYIGKKVRIIIEEVKDGKNKRKC